MIADAVGVTKAAVYHQYRTKDEIVLAVAEQELGLVEEVVAATEAEVASGIDPRAARERLVDRVVGLAVERRRLEAMLLGDPAIVRFFADHPRFRDVMGRLYRLLGGPSEEGILRGALVTAAIGGAVMHPLVADLDDDTLCAHLRSIAGGLLESSAPSEN
jgi:AcrR family transcriptional regulator